MTEKCLLGIIVVLLLCLVLGNYRLHRKLRRHDGCCGESFDTCTSTVPKKVFVPENSFDDNKDLSAPAGVSACSMEGGIFTGGSCGNDNLLPILESAFNLRECAKQMILLEDHLVNPEKRCNDCIKKHLLVIEGLAEEGASINGNDDIHQECNQLAGFIRQCGKKFAAGVSPDEVAKDIRPKRKVLMQKYFDAVKD